MTHHPEASASTDDLDGALDARFTFDYQQIGDLEPGQRWSTWGSCQPLSRGPEPWPDWIITDDAAVDTELGVLKTGKEADVFLLERSAPLDDRSVVLAAKRYRDNTHRTFHRNTAYTEGRKLPKKGGREARALAKSTSFGKTVAAGMWAWAEWEALVRFHRAGLPVPYPAQVDGTEILMELITDSDGAPAPRLAATRPDRNLLESLWVQLCDTITGLAGLGCVHGDLSAYNLLVAGERLVLIDLPQTVDLFGNPHGMDMLQRDCMNVAKWFVARGLDVDGEDLFGEVVARSV
ncbi:serine protein kinase RIO [Flexivirga oryzae]|uniref:non-specific serine/threonine protein kinase n=1 Tax=Flexivirga oryzae TaxID=1794944 RepID=A0A839N5T8_9MICO|nr:RIO1 family regulatory kinase/ATPase [Flexivirga oryzae]MBB2890575.1 RIO kinase 1 [Flexivirga oryzae]